MSHDLVIRNGTVHDGTGADPVTTDIAISGGTITAIGAVEETGEREIDARGMVVTPGFVDIHSHLDAQIGWDPLLTPSSNHGVTTALLGNCGVTFAPCKPDDREMLARMMESVEDIPAQAILGGLPWTWESYGEYLDALDDLDPAINVAGLVGHCAVRPYVMGERAVGGVATPDELARIAELVAQAVDEGAVGFSTSRILLHLLPDGRYVPGTEAPHEEMVAVAEALGSDGLTQNVPNLGGDFSGEIDLIRKQAQAAGGRVLFSTGVSEDPASGRKMAEVVDSLNDEGLDVTALCIPRPSGLVMGLVNEFYFRGGPWKTLSTMGFEERLAAIHDPAFVAELVDHADKKGWNTPMSQVFPLGDGVPRYADGPDESLQAMADAAGEHPIETFLRIERETDGTALFTVRYFNRSLEAIEELITSDHVLPGLGDAGAHVGQVMDAGWTTFTLRHWARERGAMSVAEAVRRMTSAPARIVGLDDRGVLAPGKRADVNVIDLDRLAESVPSYVHDFPDGGGRLVQTATGYVATVCNGEVIVDHDEHTGARPGEVLRSGGRS
ncbi:N-acyl-D-amino-acid deacylase family protein [Ilumatobacter sp.]|uniref:N-acyl-D-amino-acid deacylase family protein n=1 Tax=Ilumatobacter sp. TaxID=1967498 RepID=UPI003B524CF5